MPAKTDISADDSPLVEWAAGLAIVLVGGAFALLLWSGPVPAMDRATVPAMEPETAAQSSGTELRVASRATDPCTTPGPGLSVQ
ncbi:MAG TPA: hypothetical protein VLU43_09250 [Anaeromyxobacteraceae bacterium]|nr:hypothetical protein [Anaeromyxobacteraceae bacterium]